MIAITATEKEFITKNLPSAHIRRTVKQKSKRHKYYLEESRKAMQMLAKYRNGISIGGVYGRSD